MAYIKKKKRCGPYQTYLMSVQVMALLQSCQELKLPVEKCVYDFIMFDCVVENCHHLVNILFSVI